MVTGSSSTNYAPNEHEDVNQYDPHALQSKIMSAILKVW